VTGFKAPLNGDKPKPRKSHIKTWTTDTLDGWDERGGWRKRAAGFISKFVPEDWGNFFSPNPDAIAKNRRFIRFDDEELHVIYDGLIEHGGDAADESLMEEIEDECSYRGIKPRIDW
jgi:hypothetical protein